MDIILIEDKDNNLEMQIKYPHDNVFVTYDKGY